MLRPRRRGIYRIGVWHRWARNAASVRGRIRSPVGQSRLPDLDLSLLRDTLHPTGVVTSSPINVLHHPWTEPPSCCVRIPEYPAGHSDDIRPPVPMTPSHLYRFRPATQAVAGPRMPDTLGE